MLSDLEVIGVLPAKDLQRARAFYKDKLGLEPAEVRDDGLIYRMSQGSFLLYETPNAGSAKNTQLCWNTSDVEADVAELRGKGVVFEEYDFPGMKTEKGIAVLDGVKGAWFLDSEGNILCLSER
ncbi:MAG: VOC family protein [Cryobacterium sp.]